MSLTNPTANYEHDGFESREQMIAWLKANVIDARPTDTTPHIAYIYKTGYSDCGKKVNYRAAVHYTGKWLLKEVEGHEMDSHWYREIEKTSALNAPRLKISQAQFMADRRVH